MPRKDTNTEAHGAEFLVLGTLMALGIPSYIAHARTPAFDIVATNPANGKLARVQVKSRWESDAKSFLISNFASDFVVLVMLRRGTKATSALVFAPELYVIPTPLLAAGHKGGAMGKQLISSVPDLAAMHNDWRAIRAFLR
jgi:hypothetical protein